MKLFNKIINRYYEKKNICPVCHNYHFSKINSYEICPICGWEDDLIQLEDPDFKGGANKLSLNEYKIRYKNNHE